MASDRKLLACALVALHFTVTACVTTDGKSAQPVDPAVMESATDIAAASRALGLGGRPSLDRWVGLEPAHALAVARSEVVLDIVAMTRTTYARQSGLDDESFARAEAARGTSTGPSPSRITEALAQCPASGPSHYAFTLGLELAHALAGDGRAREAALAFDAAIARGLATQDEEGLRSAWGEIPAGSTTSEAELRTRLAQLAFARGRLDDALADARAAAQSADPRTRDAAHLVEGRVLLAQGQLEAASAVLEPLAGSADEGVRRSALAVLGVIAGEQDDLARAEGLLRRALEGDSSWDGVARASADLAVVLVRLGREEDGRAQFAAARAGFTAQSDPIGLARTLMNESAFERSIGYEERSRELDAGARKALTDGGVPSVP